MKILKFNSQRKIDLPNEKIISINLNLEFDNEDIRYALGKPTINFQYSVKEGLGNVLLKVTCLDKNNPTDRFEITEDEIIDLSLYIWENWEKIVA